MNILSFDTCLDKTYLTLFTDNKFINKVIHSDDKNYHSAYLISSIRDIVKNADLKMTDIDCISTNIGPGSFTGIRACTTVARMLAQQLSIKTIGVSSLEILSKINGADDLVALDARKNKAYLYDKKILGAIELEQVEEIVKGRNLITDDSLYPKFENSAKEIVSYQSQDFPIGEILAKITIDNLQKNFSNDWRKLKPLYIQPPPVFH